MWKELVEAKRLKPKTKFVCLIDFYVSSYTTSLSALIQARPSLSIPETKHIDLSHNTHPSMLIVGQIDEQLATVDQEIENIALAALNAGHTPNSLNLIAGGSKNERDKVVGDLAKRAWVHLACHGILEKSDPFTSHFQIRNTDGSGDGKAINLMDIIRSKVPNAELAFLSACHSAEQPENFAQNESLHLAAAIQFCGFRSVVGTMRPLNDHDGPRVAEEFYKYMFAEPKDGEEVGYKRSAFALRKVVRRMRRDREYSQTPERWVNFVHIGA